MKAFVSFSEIRHDLSISGYQEYFESRAKRKSRSSTLKWDIGLLIQDAIDDLEFSLYISFAQVFRESNPDMDSLAELAIKRKLDIDLADTKPKPPQKIAHRIFLQTNDLEFACEYSLAKSLQLLRIAQKYIHLKPPRLGKAFTFLMKASEERSVFMSLTRFKVTRSAQTRKGAKAKLAKDKDGKQKEKAFIRECWDDWQEFPEIYASQAAFARDMLSKCENLKSQKKIEDWCREWKKEGITMLAE